VCQGEALHVHYILHKNSLEDFLLRNKLPVSEQQLVQLRARIRLRLVSCDISLAHTICGIVCTSSQTLKFLGGITRLIGLRFCDVAGGLPTNPPRSVELTCGAKCVFCHNLRQMWQI
jgi:hypothetical protein